MPQESFPQDESEPLLPESPEEMEKLRIKTECREFIESNKEKISDALLHLVKDYKFVLVGEGHFPEVEPIRQEIAKCLVELQKTGLTNIVLELDIRDQDIIDNLDYSDPNIKDVLKSKIKAPGWFDGNFDILIEAKRTGLKVQLIDCTYKELPGYPKTGHRGNTTLVNNSRDEKMFSNIKLKTHEDSKTLVFIGSRHVHKKIIEKNIKKNKEVKRLGTHLAEEYGDKEVASVRFVGRSMKFDNLVSARSKTPSPEDLYDKQNEPVILPDKGPIRGDETASAADYIITII